MSLWLLKPIPQSSFGASLNISMTTSGGNGQGTFTTSNQGSGNAHNNVQPTIIIPWAIKT